jgi:peroxin-2
MLCVCAHVIPCITHQAETRTAAVNWLRVAPFCCRSVLDRLLRARLVYQQPSAARAISFEYLNRQLVWSELR